MENVIKMNFGSRKARVTNGWQYISFILLPTTWNNIVHFISLHSYSEDTGRQHIPSFTVNALRNIYCWLLLRQKEHSLASQVQIMPLRFQTFPSNQTTLNIHRANVSLYRKSIRFKSIPPRQKWRNSPWTKDILRGSFLITTSIPVPNLG